LARANPRRQEKYQLIITHANRILPRRFINKYYTQLLFGQALHVFIGHKIP
jgi:hypothetical protein